MGTYDAALSAGKGHILRLVTSEGSYSIPANTSPVNWTATLIRGSQSWALTAPSNWSVIIDGQGYSGTIPGYDFRNYASLQLAAGTTTVTHNPDGNKTITVTANFDDNNADGEIGDGTASGSMVLATIPRASTVALSATSVDAGASITATITRASSSFTHTVKWEFGTQVSTQTGIATSTSFTPPLSWLAQIPNSTSGTAAVTVTTFNGSTQVGSPAVKTFSITAPSSVVPTLTTVTNSEATAGLNAAIGKYVESFSTLDLAITGAAGIYGSTITAYKITVAGQTINAASGTSGIINASGTVNIVGTITDSRGRTASVTVPVTVLAYDPPTITSITGYRATSGGVADDNGTYVRVNINAAVKSLINSTEKNRLTYTVFSKVRGAGSWTTKAGPTTTAVGTISFNSNVLVNTYATTTAYDFRVEIKDQVNPTPTAVQFTIATATVLVDLDGANGVGIGQYRTNGMLDVKGQIYQNNGMAVIDTSSLATSSVAGITRYATNAEAIAGTEPSIAVTPAGAAAAFAGKLATNAETLTGTDTAQAVTPASLAYALVSRGGSKVLRGSVTVASLTSGSFASNAVTFSSSTFFSSAPTVLFTSYSTRLTTSISVAPTTSGFTLGCSNWSPATSPAIQVDWIAIGD